MDTIREFIKQLEHKGLLAYLKIRQKGQVLRITSKWNAIYLIHDVARLQWGFYNCSAVKNLGGGEDDDYLAYFEITNYNKPLIY